MLRVRYTAGSLSYERLPACDAAVTSRLVFVSEP
jgi:hypothetical protein